MGFQIRSTAVVPIIVIVPIIAVVPIIAIIPGIHAGDLGRIDNDRGIRWEERRAAWTARRRTYRALAGEIQGVRHGGDFGGWRFGTHAIL